MPALGSAILASILAGIYLLTHYNIKKYHHLPGTLVFRSAEGYILLLFALCDPWVLPQPFR
ncbi:hypothetical protein NXX33_22115 [Bacteroides fragilis]|nr:hypothetical protein [Bacteroides fragilis]